MKSFVPPGNPGVFAVVMCLLAGFFTLAVVDPVYRQPFADLAKVAVGGYLAMLLPPSN